jgi:uncharacterized membrane protein
MGLGWDSVLKLAAIAALVMVILSVVFYLIFQNIGYDTYSLSVILIISILAFIILRIVWRVTTKKFLF